MIVSRLGSNRMDRTPTVAVKNITDSCETRNALLLSTSLMFDNFHEMDIFLHMSFVYIMTKTGTGLWSVISCHVRRSGFGSV